MKNRYDVIIAGAGVAGLNCALHLPADKRILLICKGVPEHSDSYLAQGGICRMQGEEDYDGYFEDTMRAGHYENDPETVECMIRSSPAVIDGLVSLGVDFARREDGSFDVTREGGHSRKRISFCILMSSFPFVDKINFAVCSALNISLVYAALKVIFLSLMPNSFAAFSPLPVSGESLQPCALFKLFSKVSPCRII